MYDYGLKITCDVHFQISVNTNNDRQIMKAIWAFFICIESTFNNLQKKIDNSYKKDLYFNRRISED